MMIKAQDLTAVQGSVMLQNLSDQDIDKLAAFCEERKITEGTTVFIENMPGESLFLIKEGTIRISRMFAEGDEKTLVVLSSGDIFGEMAIIDGLPRSATARVAETAELISLKKKDFETLCQKEPELALKIVMNIVRVFSKRVREANEDYREMLKWSFKQG